MIGEQRGQGSEAKHSGSQEAEGRQEAGGARNIPVLNATKDAGEANWIGSMMRPLPPLSTVSALPSLLSIQFEVRHREQRVVCRVLNEALEGASRLEASATDLHRRKSFDRFRMLIDAAAKLKLTTLPGNVVQPLLICSEDLLRVPPEHGVPQFGSKPLERSGGTVVAPSAGGEQGTNARSPETSGQPVSIAGKRQVVVTLA
ncbi:hypothetical protein [Roseomonas sp. BN140053]|uniref:hypothetical protein n=1 Tax=Roseomonas sp. BN140053 TaxID=3391898 RepID=UPI0039E84E8A